MPEIPFKVVPPNYRTIVSGVWSDILDSWIASFEGDGGVTESRVNVKNLDGPLEKGRLKGLHQAITLTAGESCAIDIASSTTFKIVKVAAKNFQIRYATTASGTFTDTGSLLSLNFTNGGTDTPVFYDAYKSVTFNESDVIISGDDEVDAPALINGVNDFHVIVTNSGESTLSGLLAIVGANTEDLDGNFGITADTNLTATTEMGDFNGAN